MINSILFRGLIMSLKLIEFFIFRKSFAKIWFPDLEGESTFRKSTTSSPPGRFSSQSGSTEKNWPQGYLFFVILFLYSNVLSLSFYLSFCLSVFLFFVFLTAFYLSLSLFVSLCLYLSLLSLLLSSSLLFCLPSLHLLTFARNTNSIISLSKNKISAHQKTSFPFQNLFKK